MKACFPFSIDQAGSVTFMIGEFETRMAQFTCSAVNCKDPCTASAEFGYLSNTIGFDASECGAGKGQVSVDFIAAMITKERSECE